MLLQLFKTIAFMSLSTCVYAQVVVQPVVSPPPTTSAVTAWTSNSSSDKVTIENGTGANLSITINVNDDGSPNPAGIVVVNCGETTRIDAGSSAICITNDARNPVTFNSDSPHLASGTYQITQETP